MNIYILIFCSIIFQINSVKTKPNLCINCKHFLKPFDNYDKFGKCSFFPKKEEQMVDSKSYLVDGKHKKKLIKDYFYCSTAREFKDMCGEQGTKYEKNL